jgi:D-serine deaminase-like pyridoxal phosphate-dependent protein
MDSEAIAALAEETIDWRFKGLPPGTVKQLIGRELFGDDFMSPLLTLDDDALTHNIATMASWCDRRGVALAPHGKTTMAPAVFARQLLSGAWAITVATASQARVCRAFGVSRILLANQLIDTGALRWIVEELADPDFEFSCWVDSERGVELMTEALAGTRRPVDVLIELGATGARAGVRHPESAVAVARAVAASPVLRLVGVAGYEGAVASDVSVGALATVDSYLHAMRDLTTLLAAKGLFEVRDKVVVTAGGSSYFDQVADVLTARWPGDLDVLPVMRSGCYVTHDDGLYREQSPLGAAPRIVGMPPLRAALRVWARVTSRPDVDLALLTLGRRDVGVDAGYPEPRFIRRHGVAERLSGCRVVELNDQHAFLRVARSQQVCVGDWVGLGISHPCTTIDKWQLIPLVRDGRVIDLIRTFF